MDEEIISDLEEPTHKKAVGPQEKLIRRWHLALTLYAMAMLYAFLHKTLIPLGLGYLKTSRSEYAIVSYEIAWVLLLGYFLHRDQKLNQRVQFLIGSVIGFASQEIILSIVQSTKGWLFFSHLLASIPLLVAVVCLLSFTKRLSFLNLSMGFVFYYAIGGFLWNLSHSLGKSS